MYTAIKIKTTITALPNRHQPRRPNQAASEIKKSMKYSNSSTTQKVKTTALSWYGQFFFRLHLRFLAEKIYLRLEFIFFLIRFRSKR